MNFDTLKKAVAADPTLSTDVKTEAEANDSVTKGPRNVLDFVSYFNGSWMGLGAVCGALSSLHAAGYQSKAISRLRRCSWLVCAS